MCHRIFSHEKLVKMDIFIGLIAKQVQITEHQVKNTVKLLSEGATIPFISRYRKELTAGLDEVQIGDIAELHLKLTELAKRKEIGRASCRERV